MRNWTSYWVICLCIQTYMEEVARDPERVGREWETLQTLDTSESPTTAASCPVNRRKNRSSSILPCMYLPACIYCAAYLFAIYTRPLDKLLICIPYSRCPQRFIHIRGIINSLLCINRFNNVNSNQSINNVTTWLDS